MCGELGITTVVDTGSYRASCEEYLGGIDHVIAPEKFFRARHPEDPLEVAMKKVYADFSPSVLAATRGESGGCWLDAEGMRTYSSHPVSAVDTSGAGDTFHGAYTWAVAAGVPIGQSFRVAAWVAAQKCRAIGNDGLPDAPALAAAKQLAGWP